MSTTTAILGLLLVGIGAVGGWYGYRRYRQRTVIASVETTDALRVTPGPAEVYGTAVPLEEPFRAPFSRQDCVLAEWEIEEWEASGKHSNWRTEGSGTLTTPFYVEDETDRVLVRPGEATVELSQPQETVEVGVDEDRIGFGGSSSTPTSKSSKAPTTATPTRTSSWSRTAPNRSSSTAVATPSSTSSRAGSPRLPAWVSSSPGRSERARNPRTF